MESEKYVDKAKEVTLYEARNEDKVAEKVIENGNYNLNPKMAINSIIRDGLIDCMPGRLREMLLAERITDKVAIAQKNIDGWGVESAIKVETAKNLTQVAEKKEGILGKLGGK